MREKLIALLGPPSYVFKNGETWWARIDATTLEQAREIAPDIYVTTVYAYPDKVSGGQKYDICLY